MYTATIHEIVVLVSMSTLWTGQVQQENELTNSSIMVTSGANQVRMRSCACTSDTADVPARDPLMCCSLSAGLCQCSLDPL